jgi:hypothetical protein
MTNYEEDSDEIIFLYEKEFLSILNEKINFEKYNSFKLI